MSWCLDNVLHNSWHLEGRHITSTLMLAFRFLVRGVVMVFTLAFVVNSMMPACYLWRLMQRNSRRFVFNALIALNWREDCPHTLESHPLVHRVLDNIHVGVAVWILSG
jgi:hypothetical protein